MHWLRPILCGLEWKGEWQWKWWGGGGTVELGLVVGWSQFVA